MTVIRIRLLATVAMLMAIPGIASAATTGTTFNVSTEVQSACLVSATDLTFGVYSPSAAVETTASTAITVTCSLATPYTVSLGNGSNASGSTRRMGTGSNRISYGLFSDPSRTAVFGTAANALGVSGVGSGAPQVITVYGAIPASQNVQPGSYSDQVVVTLDY